MTVAGRIGVHDVFRGRDNRQIPRDDIRLDFPARALCKGEPPPIAPEKLPDRPPRVIHPEDPSFRVQSNHLSPIEGNLAYIALQIMGQDYFLPWTIVTGTLRVRSDMDISLQHGGIIAGIESVRIVSEIYLLGQIPGHLVDHLLFATVTAHNLHVMLLLYDETQLFVKISVFKKCLT
jgi:hypothetical protein